MRAHPEGERYSFPDDFPLPDQPYPLRRLYILKQARVEPEGIRRLRGSEAFMSLVSFTYCPVCVAALDGEVKYFVAYARIARSVPLFEWIRPWGLNQMGMTLDRLEEHL